MKIIALALLTVMASVTTTFANVKQPSLGLTFDLPSLLEKSNGEKVLDAGLLILPPLPTSGHLMARGYGQSAPRTYKGGGQLELRGPAIKKDGTVVSPHLKTRPDNNLFNNLMPPKQNQIDKCLHEGRGLFGP